jgi:SpoVK/Ycf46/Vps4 family AAA+-type ATPase
MNKVRKRDFIKEIEEKYKSGENNAFMLTGNIDDYQVPGLRLELYLEMFLKKMQIVNVNIYDISLDDEDFQAYNYMLDSLKNKKNVAWIIKYPELLFDNKEDYLRIEEKTRMLKFRKLIDSQDFIDSDNIVFLVGSSQKDINRLITDSINFSIIEVDYPSEIERYEYINFLEGTSDKLVVKEITLEEFAKLTSGLTLMEIENIFIQAELDAVLKRDMVIKKKEEMIKKEYGEVLEAFDTSNLTLDDFGGKEQIKKYHREVIIEPLKKGETDIVPKGVLYTGPPGTGKTYFAKCLAGEARINFVELKMSSILDKYVGESEKRLEKAFSGIKSLAPVGVFIDEIDQVLSRGENDTNSVGRNLFSMFLSFLSEPSLRGKVILIGATNYPNKIDEALKRSGRFDKKIPFLLPNKEERMETFRIHLKKLNNNEGAKHDYLYTSYLTEDGRPAIYKAPLEGLNNEERIKYNYSLFANLTKDYSQAEIENVCIKSLEIAKRNKRRTIAEEDVLKAIEYIIPAKNENIKEMTKLAIKECNDRELLAL